MTAAPRPPSRAFLALYRRVVNPVIRFSVLRLGAGRSGVKSLRILRVRGRTTGRVREVPVGVAELDGHRYVLTMMGDAQWARNLRAAGQAQLVSGRTAEDVTAREIHGQDKIAVLTRCCQLRQYQGPARVALRSAFGKTVRQIAEPEIELLSQIWFVFLLQNADPRRAPVTPAG